MTRLDFLNLRYTANVEAHKSQGAKMIGKKYAATCDHYRRRSDEIRHMVTKDKKSLEPCPDREMGARRAT